MVTHRSGLPRHDMVWYNNHHSTRRELVESLAHLPATAQLRTRYQYNNLMFLTAGYLIETLTGDSWEDALRDRIFQPLGMRRSNFSVLDSQKDPDHALPYRENDQDELERIPFRQIDLIGPAGSINSSVNEMSRWLLFNLSGGELLLDEPIRFERQPLKKLSEPAYLAGLTGTFQRPGQTIRIELTGSVLNLDIAGQPRYTLKPDLGGRFVIKELPAYGVGFKVDSQGKATSVTFYQPNGIFESKRVQE